MKLKALLSLLLVACLLLSPMAVMEDDPSIEVIEETSAEPVVEDEAVEGEVEEVAADAVDEIVEEEEEALVLEEEPELEAQSIEEAFELPDDYEEADGEPELEAAAGIAINDDNFWDDDFLELVSNSFDSNHDGVLSDAERMAVTAISLGDPNNLGKVSSLNGIEYFPNITSLDVAQNDIDSIDISGYSKLKSISIDYCFSLTSLNISNNPALENIWITGGAWNRCKATITNNSKLVTINLSSFDLLTLNISGCQAVTDLSCESGYLEKLDVSGMPALERLSCEYNGINTLDISNCSKLTAIVNPGNYELDSDRVDYHNSNYSVYLHCDPFVTIIGGNPVAPVGTPKPTLPPSSDPDPSGDNDPTPKPTQKTTPAPTATPKPTPTPMPVVKVAKKSAKATVNVGTQYKIDLNGATAKSFKSSKKKIATVDGNGVVTPKAKGKVKITIKIGKKKRTLTLTVKDPTIPTKVSLNMAGTVAAKKGTSVTLTATLPAGTNSGIKWKSSNKKIATVNNGVVTFKKKGKVTITATTIRGKKKAKVKFKVSN